MMKMMTLMNHQVRMVKKMKIEKMIQAGIGLYLILPGPEDAAAAGTTVIPSAILGAALVADAFGVEI